MSLSAIFFIVVLLGAVFGAKKPWMGSVVGLIAFPLLHVVFLPSKISILFITAICGAIIAGMMGFVGSLFYSGFKGKAHNTGPAFMGGFGGGRGGAPPGGIIMSDDEREKHR